VVFWGQCGMMSLLVPGEKEKAARKIDFAGLRG